MARRAASYPCLFCSKTPETKKAAKQHLKAHKAAVLKLFAPKKKKTPEGV